MAHEVQSVSGHSHSTHAHGNSKENNFHNSSSSIKGLYLRIVVIATIVALIISGYRMVLAVLHDLRNEIFFGEKYKYIFAKGFENNKAMANLGPILLVLAGMALLVILIDKLVPTNKGTGVGQVLAKLHDQKYKNKPVREIIAKFFSSAAGIFAGVAVGPESPACHMGGLVGEKAADITKADNEETEYLVASGAVAASASAFNLRLGALLFAQEELYQRFTRKTLIASLVAILVADFVNRLVMTPFYFLYNGYSYKHVDSLQMGWKYANKPVFDMSGLGWFKSLGDLGFGDYIIATIGVVLVAIIIAYIAFGLKKFTLFLYFRIKNWNRALKLAGAFVLVIPVVLFLPEAISASYVFLKYTIVDESVFTHVEAWRLIVAAIALILFTAYVQAIDFPGGIIVPFLAIGACLGLAAGILIGDLFEIGIQFRALFMLAGMAAMLGAGGRTPLMAVALVLETTGAYIIFPAILLSGFVADLIEGVLPVSKPLAVVAAEELLGYHLDH